MKILISADMEGATGVTWPADVEPGTEQWQRCRRMFTSDVNAAVAGFFDGGATAVIVNEAHATMRNLLLEELDARAVMLTGRHKKLSMVEGIQHDDVAGVAFVGYHAAAGAEGVLAHTYLPNSITAILVNDQRASEGLLNSYVAAEYGVPIVLVTGDDRTCTDARGYGPGVPGGRRQGLRKPVRGGLPPAGGHRRGDPVRRQAGYDAGRARRAGPRRQVPRRGRGGRGATCPGRGHRSDRAADRGTRGRLRERVGVRPGPLLQGRLHDDLVGHGAALRLTAPAMPARSLAAGRGEAFLGGYLGPGFVLLAGRRPDHPSCRTCGDLADVVY